MARFWLSWEERSEDYRPLRSPPGPKVLGWWCTGYTSMGDGTICALVEAATETKAKAAIREDWPGRRRWRFIEEKPTDWTPGDRFPLDWWAKERIENGGAHVG